MDIPVRVSYPSCNQATWVHQAACIPFTFILHVYLEIPDNLGRGISAWGAVQIPWMQNRPEFLHIQVLRQFLKIPQTTVFSMMWNSRVVPHFVLTSWYLRPYMLLKIFQKIWGFSILSILWIRRSVYFHIRNQWGMMLANHFWRKAALFALMTNHWLVPDKITPKWIDHVYSSHWLNDEHQNEAKHALWEHLLGDYFLTLILVPHLT